MNNAWKSVLGVLGVIALNVSTHVHAQQNGDIPDKPTPPFVAPVPDFFQWTITVTDKGGPAEPKPDPKNPTAPPPGIPIPKKVIYTKTKDIACNVILFSNGKHSEIWFDKGTVITRSPAGETSINEAGSMAAHIYVSDMASTGFLDVDWPSLDNFVSKTSTKDGGAVFVYRSESPPPVSAIHAPQFVQDEMKKHPQEKQKPAIREAMIAADSKLPLVVVDGFRTYQFSYQPAPTAMLQLPPDLAGMLEETAKQKKYAEALRAIGRQ